MFDLDNTLYPPECELFSQIDWRMTDFIADHFGLDRETARARQKAYFRSHGTTLRGLMTEHGMDPAPFLDFVHQIDLSHIPAAPDLGTALAALPGRKLVYTNGSQAHADNVMGHLGIAGHFEDVFDIVRADYQPKPHAESYRRMLDHFGIDRPDRAAMVEDIARNLGPARDLGMTTIWLRNEARWAAPEAASMADHVIDDLTLWLSGVARRAAAATSADRG